MGMNELRLKVIIDPNATFVKLDFIYVLSEIFCFLSQRFF